MCQVTHTKFNLRMCRFMGLFKKACCDWRRRVRQTPVSMTQLDLFGEQFNERMLYVRSSKERPSYGKKSFKEDVFGRSPMDASGECPF
ncbi:MAG: hypothetical protein [Microviridae sp. ctnrr37]|nr:MAG: hypothetical protein [Microviridae sp. ctnrr37]